MALKTQGFQLSEMPRAPKVPGNIGSVDVGEIDKAVRERLKTFETVRQLPRSMALADEEADTGIAKSQAARAALPLAERRDVANTVALETQLPLKSTILAAEADPAFLEAKRRALLARGIPTDVRAFEMLTHDMTPEQIEAARRVRMGLQARPSSAAITYREVVGPDGVTRLVAVDPRGVGAQVIGTGETYGTGVANPPGVIAAKPVVAAGGLAPAPITADTVAVAPVGPDTVAATPAPNLFQSQTAQEAAAAKTTGTKTAEAQVEAHAKLPKFKTNLDALESKTSRINADIDEAIKLAPGSSGFASLMKSIPGTKPKKLDNLLTSIRANAGFDTLTEMRQNSPTGGALGNVSDFEGKSLQAAIATMDQALKDSDLIEALKKVKAARTEALERTRQQFQREVKFFGLDKDASLLGDDGGFKIIEIR